MGTAHQWQQSTSSGAQPQQPRMVTQPRTDQKEPLHLGRGSRPIKNWAYKHFLSVSFSSFRATAQNIISPLPKPTHGSDSEHKHIPALGFRPLTSCLFLPLILSFLTWSNCGDLYFNHYKNIPQTLLAPRLQSFCAISLSPKIVI